MNTPTTHNPSEGVAVVTDSAAAFGPEKIDHLGLRVARMEITIDGETHVDGPDSGLDDFYERLANSTEIPTTSAPKPAEYLEQFNLAAEEASAIFLVSLSARLSAAFDAAKVAADLFMAERPDFPIKIFDSQTAASSQALIVTAAARAASTGGNLDEVETAARKVAGEVRLLAVLDTLKYIHRSGRVPRIAVWATSALNIKPVMEYSVGKIGAIARPRTTRRAIERLRTEMIDDVSDRKVHVNVMHAGALEHAQQLEQWVSKNLDCAELFVTQFHPFMGAHTGPGLIGASWWAE